MVLKIIWVLHNAISGFRDGAKSIKNTRACNLSRYPFCALPTKSQFIYFPMNGNLIFEDAVTTGVWVEKQNQMRNNCVK